MLLTRLAMAVLPAGLTFASTDPALAQNYPTKPIRIVTAEPGGSNDFMTRMIGQGITANLGQQVITDNRGGGGGVIAAQIVARAPLDGYTLLFYNTNIFLQPFLRDGVPFNVGEFAPVSLATTSPAILVVHPALPVNSVRELIALAKARPGALSYSSGGFASATHLSAELFKAIAGVNIVHVPYKGGGPSLNGIIAGEVQVMFGTAATKIYLESGKLKALAVTSAQPSALFPGMPTVAATGLPGYESTSLYGLYAPVKTPAALIERISAEVARAISRPEIKDRFFNAGVEVVGSNPAQFAAELKSDMARMVKVIRDAGIRAD